MIPVTAKWGPAHAVNHRPTSRVEIWRTGTRLLADLRIESGEVTKDAGQYPRTTARLTVADTSYGTAQLCTPFGNRVRIYSGIRYPDNTSEEILLGDLDIFTSHLNRPDGLLEIEAADPSGVISQHLTSAPVQTQWTTSAQLTIQSLLEGAAYYGSKTLVINASDSPVPADFVIDGDRWDAIEQLADMCGAEVFFTPSRVPTLQSMPGLKPTPDATLYTLAGGNVMAMDSMLERAPNIVVVALGPDANGRTVRGIARDTLTTSPTYINGAYGRVVLREERPSGPVSQSTANKVAADMLKRVQGKTRTVKITAVANPAIEPRDTVAVRYLSGRIERHLVQGVVIPLGAEDMTVDTRTTEYQSFGWP